MNKKSMLHQKLGAAFTQPLDFYPCFDWQFPPPGVRGEPKSSLFEQRLSEIDGKYSIYLHTPFCLSICKFCYYSVSAAGEGSEVRTRYLDSVLREIEAFASRIPAGAKCESVYIGGGTPTALGEELVVIIETLSKKFDLSECEELTVESSPNTLSCEYLATLKAAGVNRMSYGVQTLEQDVLTAVNRHYDVDSILEDLKLLGEVIGNFNVDTMYDLPGEGPGSILDTIRTLAKFAPGITLYALDPIREKGIAAMNQSPEETQRKFNEARQLLLDLGYTQIFQNNFVRDGGSYIHQRRRWDNMPVIGIGPSAQGYLPRLQYANTHSVQQYQKREGEFAVDVQQQLDRPLEIARELTTKLRFTGLDVAALDEKYGTDVLATFRDLTDALVGAGQLELVDGVLQLTTAGQRNNNIIPMMFSPDAITDELSRMQHPLAPVFGNFGVRQSAPF